MHSKRAFSFLAFRKPNRFFLTQSRFALVLGLVSVACGQEGAEPGSESRTYGTQYPSAFEKDRRTCSQPFLDEVTTLNTQRAQAFAGGSKSDLLTYRARVDEFDRRFAGVQCVHPVSRGRYHVDRQLEEARKRLNREIATAK
jgi:hypothetical protein